jgi:CheY-like chemotaxis protein
MAGVLESGVVVRGLECMVERPDGSLRNVVTNIDPIRDQYGRIIGAVNVSQDVTARPAEQPVKEQPKSRPCPLGRSNASCTREGTILVVDDEEMVRTGIRLFLELYGLNVIDCADGAEALRIGSALKDEMVLLITDYMMPKMTGSELAQSMARIRPDLPIIFMSGYAAGEIGHERFAGATFLQKPFTRAKLVDMVCKGLESCPRSNRHPGTVTREANLVAVAH